VLKKLLILIGGTLLSVSCNKTPEQGTCSIVLLTPRTGTQAALNQIGRAKLLVEDELRSAGDSTVSIREVDTQGQPAVARAELERVLGRWACTIVVGSILSTETREFLQPTLQRGAIVLANGSSDPTIRNLSFRHPRDGFLGIGLRRFRRQGPMAEYLQKNRAREETRCVSCKRCVRSGFSRRLYPTLSRTGGDVIGRKYTKQILHHLKPSCVVYPKMALMLLHSGLPPDLAGMYNAIRRNPKLAHTPIYTAVAAETTEFRALVRTNLDNIFFTAPSVDQSSSSYSNSERHIGDVSMVILPMSSRRLPTTRSELPSKR